MHTVRIRIAGDRRAVDALVVDLHAMDTVDRVEEVADQMHRRDDTSSLGLSGDTRGSDFHDIEVHVTDARAAEAVRDRVEIAGRDLEAAIEFVDEF
jgi:hypothetical protein